MGHQMTSSRDRPLALGLFAVLFSVYLLTFSGVYHSSDEMSMLAVTDSLARRGAWDIELLRWMGEQQGSFGPDGHLYSRKGIGTTLAALPYYGPALQSRLLPNIQTAMLTNGVITALTGWLVYLLLRRLRYSYGVSLLAALAFGLGTMAWPYARYLFSESLAGLGLMLSLYFLVRLRDEQDLPSALWAGAGLGIALLARLNNAIAAPFLGLLLLVYLYRQHGRNWQSWLGPVVLFGLPVLVSLAITGWYNWLRFGSPLTTGYLPQENFSTPLFEGLYGLTFSPGKGIFWYNPILLVALIAWPTLYRRHRAEATLIAAIVLANLAFYAPWYLWWAGHAWGPRFLVTILPFAALSLAPALEAALRRRALALVLGALAVVSVAVQIPGVAVSFNLYLEEIHAELGLYDRATLFDPAYSPLLRQIAYLRLENLDLAWARGGAIDWVALLAGLGLVGVSGLALWGAWRRRLTSLMTAGLTVLLAGGALLSMLRYASSGDVAQAAHALASMEEPGEAVALTEPGLTEAFQDTYDGRLWVWGVPSRHGVAVEHNATWSAGRGDPDATTARFQVGAVRLDLFATPGQPFDPARLPPTPPEETARLGDKIELLAFESDDGQIPSGGTLSVALYWRALAPMDTSYTVFVQAIDEAGSKIGQVDRIPCNGGCPTTTWRAGDLVGERYDLAIGIDTPPGQYRIISGMYDLATMENLPWLNAQGEDVGNYLVLGKVDVQ
jgi:hypothetical protein